jgi:SAM-dependent methyltransferase
MQLPIALASFDAVVTQDVFEHLPDPRRALPEIHRDPSDARGFPGDDRLRGRPRRVRGSERLPLPCRSGAGGLSGIPQSIEVFVATRD